MRHTTTTHNRTDTMGHSYSSVDLHCVFSTKYRQPFITDDIRSRLYSYMDGIIGRDGGTLRNVGGIEDHVHLLLTLPRTITIADMLHNVKGASSKWVHDEFGKREFAWQTGYSAFSVGRSERLRIHNYIDRQVSHHKRESFKTEYRRLLDQAGVEYDERFLWD